jgi:hypothetical protein
MARRMNFQTISWFWDLYQRHILDLDPPYQRRSVWNQSYKDYFVDTLLLQYPAPAIFLFEDLDTEGRTSYNVVDGKQRLLTIFEFAQNRFPVGDKADVTSLRGMYFRSLPDDTKRAFWSYQFSVEYVPDTNETVLKDVFDRINRNVVKLTPQELRHARFEGAFITKAEELSDWMLKTLPAGFPNVTGRSLKQMKDVELTATLLLQLDEGVKSYSQTDLDAAFAQRDESWEKEVDVEARFRATIQHIGRIIATDPGKSLIRTRLRNQTDFYSLFGALSQSTDREPDPHDVARRLEAFIAVVDDDDARLGKPEASEYYEAARSASNDAGPRGVRIRLITDVINGNIDLCQQP